MGSWGQGPFDNDAAVDFLDGLPRSVTRPVQKVLEAIVEAPSSARIDVDDASAGWAACELVALAFGYGASSPPNDTVAGVAARLKPNEDLRLLALQVLPRITARDRSELAALWHEGPSGAEFDRQLHDLGGRLQAAAAGPRTHPRAKPGDVFLLADSADAPLGVVLQVVAAGEVAVFAGAVDESAALDAARSRPMRRVPAALAPLARIARPLGHVPLRKDLKSKKFYASEAGALEDYVLCTAAAGGTQLVTYDEARTHDRFRRHDVDALRAIARGELEVERVRSPDEREAELRAIHRDRWAERRRRTSPGPFGDLVALEQLLEWIEQYGIENAVRRFHDLSRGAQGYGRPNEDAERRSYAFVGVVAAWLGPTPPGGWPDEWVTRFPSAPNEPLYTTAVAAARVLVDQVLTRDAELRLIWDESPEGDAALRSAIDHLKARLA